MSNKLHVKQIFEELKSKMKSLNPTEKESFRDNLLTYLLFGDAPVRDNYNQPVALQGITDEERDLIRKLAAQTEKLFRISYPKPETDAD